MKIGIFYITEKPDRTNDHTPFRLPSGRLIWIRVEEVYANNTADALDMASLREGESLMNTHEIP